MIKIVVTIALLATFAIALLVFATGDDEIDPVPGQTHLPPERR